MKKSELRELIREEIKNTPSKILYHSMIYKTLLKNIKMELPIMMKPGSKTCLIN